MKNLDIVRNFVDEGNKAQLAATKEFTVQRWQGAASTCWAPTARSRRWTGRSSCRSRGCEAYRGVYEMQRTARLLALLAVLLSIDGQHLSPRAGSRIRWTC